MARTLAAYGGLPSACGLNRCHVPRAEPRRASAARPSLLPRTQAAVGGRLRRDSAGLQTTVLAYSGHHLLKMTTMAVRARTAIETRLMARIEKLTQAHEAFDPQRPPKAWREEMSEDELAEHVSALLDAYELVAPHIQRRELAVALRNLFRAHPKLRPRGPQAEQPDNYITHDGAPFYWGGIRVGKDGKTIPGGIGRFPLDLFRYAQTSEGKERLADGEPLFYPINSAEGKRIARRQRRAKTERDSKEGKALIRLRQRLEAR